MREQVELQREREREHVTLQRERERETLQKNWKVPLQREREREQLQIEREKIQLHEREAVIALSVEQEKAATSLR